MAFINERLLEKVAYGFSGGPTWDTTKVQLRSGRTKRNANRSNPLHKYAAPFSNIRPEHYDVILDTFNACLGSVHSFRFAAPDDWQLNDEIIGVSDGSVDETMQIIKPYTFGPAGFEVTNNRIITKPVDSTVYTSAVALSVTEDAGGGATPLAFTCDYETGILTFTSTFGNTIRVTGEFDVPVFFNEDQMDFEYGTYQHLTGDIILMEDFDS